MRIVNHNSGVVIESNKLHNTIVRPSKKRFSILRVRNGRLATKTNIQLGGLISATIRGNLNNLR